MWRAYTLKEALRAIFAPGLTVADVQRLIDRFISRAQRSQLKPFIRLAKTIRKHRDGIVAASRIGLTNARTEANNNKVRLITRRAYGFHTADAALALVTLTCFRAGVEAGSVTAPFRRKRRFCEQSPARGSCRARALAEQWRGPRQERSRPAAVGPAEFGEAAGRFPGPPEYRPPPRRGRVDAGDRD